MSEQQRRKQEQRRRREERRQRKDEGPVENCVEAVADSCSGCRTCCPEMWLASIFLALVRPAAARTARRPGAGADPAAPRPAGRAAGAMYDAVRHYRVAVSPTRPACCPYTPSCSTYAVKALQRHGALRGGRLVLGRLLRCRPGAARRRGFSDPVPD
ncbi:MULTISPECIES: membrane protein insertion efficiency factor YidD [unclassified Streptomyces]|uniref:membrane protein insertion efficiency factor YidD n=1 Tax=unclassified Streptomyces TaxID=2593676 RepID=UPI002258292D|nr:MULTISPECIES: membrane protein insertion efficiency factor YidD [unclassified Streptomyces]MCX4524196.1 membrane protein insertion efficiency factor YidD [Streptomyces sp. NBC_01551]MCX4545285.1 membrane protein insertion efficiency factor YidD [Streptomyces sp. NBC_01565]